MNPRTEQPWLDTEAAHETVCNVRHVSLDFRIMPEPMPLVWRITFAGALVFIAVPVLLTLAWVVTP